MATYLDNFDSYANGSNLQDAADWDVGKQTNGITIYKPASDGAVKNNAGAGVSATVYRVGTFSANQWSQITMENISAGINDMGPAVRCSGTSCYMWTSTQTLSYLTRLKSGTSVDLVTGTAWTNGDTVKLVIIGQTLYCYRNGSLDTSISSDGIYTDTDTDIASGNPGIACWGTGSNYGDNWYGGEVDLNYGLTAYWKLDESSGNALDSVGTNNGTVYNVTQNSSGKLGTSYLFNGTSSYISFSSITSSTTYSFSVWIKWDNTQPDTVGNILCNNTTTLYYVHTNGNIYFYLGTNYVCTNSPLSNGVWTHFVVSVNGGTGKTYINGSYVRDIGVSITSQSFNQIGHSYSTEYYKGNFDEIGFWNRALTPTEITRLYNSGIGISYPFNEYSGVLYIWTGSVWRPSPLAVQNGGMQARPVRFYSGGTWNLVQSF